jgi:hypothetical protein
MLNSDLAVLDPSAVFATPEQLRDSADLTTDEKIDILSRWAYDESEMAVATEEGMPEAGQSDLQHLILLALRALGSDVELERTGPTKQHGLPVTSRNGP